MENRKASRAAPRRNELTPAPPVRNPPLACNGQIVVVGYDEVKSSQQRMGSPDTPLYRGGKNLGRVSGWHRSYLAHTIGQMKLGAFFVRRGIRHRTLKYASLAYEMSSPEQKFVVTRSDLMDALRS